MINGSLVRVLVDTGASTSTLDAEAAKSLKLNVVPAVGTAPTEGHANALVVVGDVPLTEQSFTVMDLGFINIPSKRFGTEPFAGQLGASFFTEFNATIDFPHMVMCLAAPRRAT
jgi:hypothetical protein